MEEIDDVKLENINSLEIQAGIKNILKKAIKSIKPEEIQEAENKGQLFFIIENEFQKHKCYPTLEELNKITQFLRHSFVVTEQKRNYDDLFVQKILEENKRLMEENEMLKMKLAVNTSIIDKSVNSMNNTEWEEEKEIPLVNPEDGTSGGIYDVKFINEAKRLYEIRFGVENMGPLLYTLIRFLKPRKILEVGCGYTSLWILQALKDNYDELISLKTIEKKTYNGVPLYLSSYFQEEIPYGILHCVDNLEHKHTTANKVLSSVEKLGLFDFLEFHVTDAFQLADNLKDQHFDLLWLDFGAGDRIGEFFDKWWQRVRPGGFVLVHSTLTNQKTRTWLESMRQNKISLPEASPYGPFGLFSFLEPHKLFQNSFSIFQKRENYSEPIYSVYP